MQLIIQILINQVIFANELTSVECQNPINWNFLLENPQDPSPFKITCDMPPRPVKNTVLMHRHNHIYLGGQRKRLVQTHSKSRWG